ncbi:MAG: hypothetical protein U0K93_02365 [Acutalibacteraceae bacterium]|nr:hypothetical protein [Acutalibacteraceae bacterium]
MKIKTQKIIMFIPFVNFSLVFMFLLFMKRNNIEAIYFLKALIKISLFLLLNSIVLKVIIGILDNNLITSVLEWFFIYFDLFIIAFVSVKAQEQHRQE